MANRILELITILILFDDTLAEFKQRRITTFSFLDFLIQIVPDVGMESKFDSNGIRITEATIVTSKRTIHFEFQETRVQHLPLELTYRGDILGTCGRNSRWRYCQRDCKRDV